MIALVVLAAVAFAGFVASRISRPLPQGSVDVAAQDRASSPFKVRQAGSAAWIALYNRGEQPARIESIRPVGVDRGLVVEHVYVVGHARPRMGYCCSRRWPVDPASYSLAFPTALLKPAKGAVVLPDRRVPRDQLAGVTVVLVLRADTPGDYAFRGLEVRYSIDGRDYRRVVTNAFTMCVSKTGQRTCSPKEGFNAEQAAKL